MSGLPSDRYDYLHGMREHLAAASPPSPSGSWWWHEAVSVPHLIIQDPLPVSHTHNKRDSTTSSSKDGACPAVCVASNARLHSGASTSGVVCCEEDLVALKWLYTTTTTAAVAATGRAVPTTTTTMTMTATASSDSQMVLHHVVRALVLLHLCCALFCPCAPFRALIAPTHMPAVLLAVACVRCGAGGSDCSGARVCCARYQ